MANHEWDNWGRSIQELIDKAVNSQDYQELSRNIGKTIDKAFSASSEAVRRAANSAPKNSAYHYNYTTPKVTVEPKKETLPALYGNPNGETTKGILQTVFGGILALAALGLVIPFGVLSIVGSAGFVVGFLAGGAALVGGTALLCSGIGTLAKVSRFKVYLKALGTKTSITLERLSRSVGKNERFVRKELQKMIKQGLFLEGHLDNEQKNLITSDETFREFERSRLELEQRKRSQAVQAAKSPDPKIQEVLDKGNAYVKEIRRCNDEIPGEEISAKIDRMEAIVRKIFERAEAHPKEFSDKGYTQTCDIWSDECTAQMFKDGKTMCYFGPAWYYNFSMGNAQDAEKGCFGDWAICEGPQAHFWGGTWLLAPVGTDNPTMVADIMNTFINDEDVCTKLVKNEMQFSNNQKVNEACAADGGNDFLGGQNDTAIFCELAKNIVFENHTIYDQVINEDLQKTWREYCDGDVTEDAAMANFYALVSEAYPSIMTP